MSYELKTLTLKCAGCGAPLTVSPSMERFSCGYCGTEQLAIRQGGTVVLEQIGAAIAKVQIGTDRTAAELAVQRLKGDLAASLRLQQAQLSLAKARALTGQLSLKIGLFFLWSGGTLCAIGGVGPGLCLIGLAIPCALFYFSKQSELKQAREKANEDYAICFKDVSKEIDRKMAEVRR